MTSKILIVEDNPIVAEDLKTKLKNLGYHVTRTAYSGKQAIDSLEKEVPDLALMDIRLGTGMNGIETASILKNVYNVSVIFLTAHADDDTLSRAKLTQPLGYIVKPFSDEDLKSAIVVALHQFKMEQALKESRQQYQIVVNTIQDSLLVVDQKNSIQYVNSAFCSMYQYSEKEALGMDVSRLIHPDVHHVFETCIKELKQTGTFSGRRIDLRKNGTQFYTDVRSSVINYKGMNCFLAVVRDISKQVKNEKDLLGEKKKLQKALDDIKKLSGLIPICSYCKKIRDDKGSWNNIEKYISDHSEAVFSHGLCNDCLEKHYPE